MSDCVKAFEKRVWDDYENYSEWMGIKGATTEVHEVQSFILRTLFSLEKNGILKINSLQPSQIIK